MKRALQLAAVALLLCGQVASAQFGNAKDDIPPLRPPVGELPATFLERHQIAIVTSASIGVLAIGACVLWLRRSKPARVPDPEVEARETLSRLAADDLVGVSQVVRKCTARVMDLPASEMTTSELIEALKAASGSEQEQDLCAGTAAFLRKCERLKFAPGNLSGDPAARTEAERLIEAAGAVRRQRASHTQAIGPRQIQGNGGARK